MFLGLILARQRIIALEKRETTDNITRCAIILDKSIIRTAAVPRRPFQGWRYLETADSPPDISNPAGQSNEIPAELAKELTKIGVL